MNTLSHPSSHNSSEAPAALRWHFDEQFPEFAVDRDWDACSEVRFLPTEETGEWLPIPNEFRVAS